MTDDENPLARVNMNAWQPPPPRALDPAVLLNRMVSATPGPRRTKWGVVALVVTNVALVAALVAVLARDEPRPTVLPAGGPVVDTRTRDALHDLEEQQAQLQRQLADVKQLQATITSLSERVQKCEQKTVTSTSPGPGKLAPKTPDVVISLEPTVEGAPPSSTDTPDSLDRAMITAAVAAIRPAINKCGESLSDAMPLRVRVRVSVTPFGRPSSSVSMADAGAESLGKCVVRAMNKARFPHTRSGGTFTYPFMFGMQLE
ncbi:MAG TPA: hypothetical protein VGM39_19830 [Kofleriaceae bacterium]|jgi:hypothetical protein